MSVCNLLSSFELNIFLLVLSLNTICTSFLNLWCVFSTTLFLSRHIQKSLNLILCFIIHFFLFLLLSARPSSVRYIYIFCFNVKNLFITLPPNLLVWCALSPYFDFWVISILRHCCFTYVQNWRILLLFFSFLLPKVFQENFLLYDS